MSKHTKHTPGPWRIRPSSGGRPAIVYGNNGWPVGDVTAFPGRVSQEQQDANASLIAAAPELLAALQGMEEAYCRAGTPLTREERREDYWRLTAARAAIAKATGQQGGAAC